MNNTIPYVRLERKVPLGAKLHNLLAHNSLDRRSPQSVAKRMRELALEAGFSEAGVASFPYVDEERNARRFREWVAKGRAGTMHYLERKTEDGQLVRERVAAPFPWARSMVVCFASYLYPDKPISSKTQDPQSGRSGWIARYGWSSRIDERGERRASDYHKVLLKRLRAMEARLHEEFGEFESRAYVDTGPVVERSLAVAAGLGWTGKNTCLIHPKLGSWGFLGVLLTSLQVSEGASHPSEQRSLAGDPGREQGSELASQRVSELASQQVSESASQNASESASQNASESATATLVADRCGSCTRCIDACPTHALDAPYQMDATKCIAYLTIEHKGPIAEELMPGMGRQVFGCDICQDVCPWNGKALRDGPIRVDAELEPRMELVNPTLEWLSSLDEQSFERMFNGSPVRRTGFRGLQRNVAVAMGNSGLAQYAQKLEEWAQEADDGLRSTARWALNKLRL